MRRAVIASTLLVAAAAAAGAEPPLRVTLLGTGNPRPELHRFGPSILVEAGERRLLFDCGRGAVQRLFEMGIPLASIDRLYLTHLHSDHVVGLPDLWLTGWIFGRETPLSVRGPAGTDAMTRYLERAYAFDVHMRRDVDERLPAEGARLVAREMGDGAVESVGEVRVSAFLVDHGPVKPALGYRVDFKSHSVVLSGDTRPSENLVRHAKGVDVLVHEVIAERLEREKAARSLRPEQVERIIAHHTTAEQAGEIFARVKPKLAVYSHIVPSPAGEADLVPDTRKAWSGALEVGEDGMTIEIGETITVRRPGQK